MLSPDHPQTASEVLCSLARHPYERLWKRWNWKSAVLSSIVRATVFFVSTLGAGLHAAAGAAAAEFVFRACTAGFYGAVTEAFVPVRPVRIATLTAVLVVPTLSHTIEFVVHYSRGTPQLATAIASSVVFTVSSTAFNLYAMRQGALIVGGGESILSDLRRMPGLLCLFATDLRTGKHRMAAR